ncbi:MAG: MaoC family dehydratase [Bacillota bacterium]
MQSYHLDKLKIGDSVWMEKTVSETDIYNYAGITGDFSSLHVNEERAKNSRFGRRIAHGMLLAGFISAVLGTQLPGIGTIYVSQSIKFLKPVYIGDTVRAQVEVIEIDSVKRRVKLKTTCTNQQGEDVLIGEAVVIPPSSAKSVK